MRPGSAIVGSLRYRCDPGAKSWTCHFVTMPSWPVPCGARFRLCAVCDERVVLLIRAGVLSFEFFCNRSSAHQATLKGITRRSALNCGCHWFESLTEQMDCKPSPLRCAAAVGPGPEWQLPRAATAAVIMASGRAEGITSAGPQSRELPAVPPGSPP